MLLIAVRSIPIGWVSLGVIVYLLEHPLLHFAGPFIGAQWIATATLGVDCTVMAASGWASGAAEPDARRAGLCSDTDCVGYEFHGWDQCAVAVAVGGPDAER